MASHAAIARGGDNPLSELLVDDPQVTSLLDPAEVRRLLDPAHYVGDAPERARGLAEKIRALPPFPKARPLVETPS